MTRDTLWKSVNPFRLMKLRRGTSLKVHLGCGDERLVDFINIDYRRTRATDMTLDLNQPRFAPSSISFAYSHAFFEHLFRNTRLSHLQSIHASLESDGVCCYIGIPYFRNVARFYLEHGPGTASATFDLFNVYRYTHGDPEHQPSWWKEQLHKSLFDEAELTTLLRESGFTSFVMFCYGYPGDVNEVPVTMGFFASRSSRSEAQLKKDAESFLQRFADKKIRMQTLEWLHVPVEK